MKSVAIVLNGEVERKIEEDFIIYADGGYDKADAPIPHIIVGDMDSISVVPKSENIISVPSEKDYSDGILALEKAKDLGYTDVVIYGANGGRFDHIFANLSLLIKADEQGLGGVIKDKKADIYYKKESFSLKTYPKETISLIPNRECLVASSEGLFYPLNNLRLSYENASLGLSNKALSDNIEVNITFGALFVFHNLL